jgi:hypothetical protein
LTYRRIYFTSEVKLSTTKDPESEEVQKNPAIKTMAIMLRIKCGNLPKTQKSSCNIVIHGICNSIISRRVIFNACPKLISEKVTSEGTNKTLR